jgi:pimeloyl-ACP methyl ester carboxylesterase
MDIVIDRGFVRLDEGLVHYRERAAGAAETLPPLLLLHASPNSGLTMEPIMAAYASGRRLIAPDTLGNGDSVRPAPEQPELEDYADALDRFCEALGLGEVDIYGSHTGAHIGVELAVRKPERVRRLVVDGLLVLDGAERQDFLANYAPLQQPDEAGTQFHWAWQYIRDQMIFFPHFKKDLAHLRAGGIFDPMFLHKMAMGILGSLDTYHLAYEAVFRHDIGQRLAQISCPMQWLDTQEGYLDVGMHLMQEKTAGASVVQVAHDPQAFAEQIAVFSAEAN